MTKVSGDSTIKIALKYPKDLLGNPVAGPALKSYLQQFAQRFAHPGKSPLGHEGSANVQFSVADRPPATKSVVFHEDWFMPGAAHPGDAIATFTFNLAEGKQLQLADLFCPGFDPLKAIPPLARPYIQQALSSTSGSYAPAFTAERFEPNGQPGSLADDYRAWAIDGQDLVLYMPAERGPGGMPAGFLHPHIPLSALRSVMRDGGCSA